MAFAEDSVRVVEAAASAEGRSRPIPPGTADRLRKFMERVREEHGVLPESSVDLKHELRGRLQHPHLPDQPQQEQPDPDHGEDQAAEVRNSPVVTRVDVAVGQADLP